MAEALGPVYPLHGLLAEVRALCAMFAAALGATVAGGRGSVGLVALQVMTVL